jgi:hypothetical protein
MLNGKTYYYRVCQRLPDNSCGVFSNEISVLAQSAASTVPKLDITSVDGNKVNISYYLNPSHGGYVTMWSTDPNPTYPGPATVYTKITENPIPIWIDIDHDFVSGQQYHIRVCENLGGKCGTYSNEVTATAP